MCCVCVWYTYGVGCVVCMSGMHGVWGVCVWCTCDVWSVVCMCSVYIRCVVCVLCVWRG